MEADQKVQFLEGRGEEGGVGGHETPIMGTT